MEENKLTLETSEKTAKADKAGEEEVKKEAKKSAFSRLKRVQEKSLCHEAKNRGKTDCGSAMSIALV